MPADPYTPQPFEPRERALQGLAQLEQRIAALERGGARQRASFHDDAEIGVSGSGWQYTLGSSITLQIPPGGAQMVIAGEVWARQASNSAEYAEVLLDITGSPGAVVASVQPTDLTTNKRKPFVNFGHNSVPFGTILAQLLTVWVPAGLRTFRLAYQGTVPSGVTCYYASRSLGVGFL